MAYKKLLLIIPPQKGLLKGFATGIVSLAEYLALKVSEIRTEIEILDYSFLSPEEVKINTLDYQKTENLIVGITTTTASYQSALYVAKNFKRSNSSCTVILGGHHASADPENILTNHKRVVDYIITGEGEIALFKFIKNFPKVDNTPNLVFIKEDRIIRNPPAPFLTEVELDQISLSYKETELYGHPGKFDTITYVSARGCPLKCHFCAVANQKMRAKSVTKVKDDISKLLDLGFTTIAIEDNFFAHSPNRTLALCDELQELQSRGKSFKWDCQTRVESLKNLQIIQKMEKAGCYAIYLGIEALNNDHLLYLGKSSNPERYLSLLFETVIPNILETKVDCYINLQLGIPNSISNHHRKTMDSLRRIGNMALKKGKTITVFPQLHVIYPGTKHFVDAVAQTRFNRAIYESFTEWEAQQDNLYGWMGENFAHGTGGIPEGIINQEMLVKSEFIVDSEKILQIQRQLSDIRNIPGIQLFEYKKYLV